MTLNYTEKTPSSIQMSVQSHPQVIHTSDKDMKMRRVWQSYKLYVKLLKEAFCLGLRLIKLIFSNGMARPLSSRAQDMWRQGRGRATGTGESISPRLLSPPFAPLCLSLLMRQSSLHHTIDNFLYNLIGNTTLALWQSKYMLDSRRARVTGG